MDEKERENKDNGGSSEELRGKGTGITFDPEALAHVFEILKLDITCDKKQIRKAYTSLIRSISPEDDPEGFAKLHDAYKSAMFYADVTSAPSGNLIPKGLGPAPDGDSEVSPDNEDQVIKDSYDFSSVDMSGAPPKTTAEFIIDDIVDFKNDNGLSSAKTIDAIPNGTRMRLTTMLLMMYRALAFHSDDETVWDSFLEEQIVKLYIKDVRFRQFLRQALPQGSKHFDHMNDLIDMYDNFFGENSIGARYSGTEGPPAVKEPLEPNREVTYIQRTPSQRSREADKRLKIFAATLFTLAVIIFAVSVIILWIYDRSI